MNHAEPPTPASHPAGPPTARRRLAGPVAVGLTALLLGGVAFTAAGSALAEDATSSPSASVDSDRDGQTLRERLRERFLDRRDLHGPELGGPIAMGGGIHGEFLAPDGSGGYRTTLTQLGEVTSVSRDSITVKSEDNYTHTYVVTDSTIVNARRDGIDDVTVGHDVHILAVRRDGDDAAVHIGDLTTMRESAEGWKVHPGGEPPALELPNDTTT